MRLPNLLRFPRLDDRFLLVDFEFAKPFGDNGRVIVEELDMARKDAGGAALCALQKFGGLEGVDQLMLYNSMEAEGFFL